MPWQCDCCGWENPIDDRIGRQEPPCIRCGRPRGSRAATIAELETDIDDLLENASALKKRLHHTQEIINDLEHDMAQYTSQRTDLVTELQEVSSAIATARKRLEAIKTYDPALFTRQIAEDQRTLDEVRA